MPLIDAREGGFVGALTDRAMVVWQPQQGVFMFPLGRAYYEQLRAEPGMLLHQRHLLPILPLDKG